MNTLNLIFWVIVIIAIAYKVSTKQSIVDNSPEFDSFIKKNNIKKIE